MHQMVGEQQSAQQPVQKVELEDDGVPVQTAPSYRVRNAPDDPTQPWSPNYGRSPSAIPSTAAAVLKPLPIEQRRPLRVADGD